MEFRNIDSIMMLGGGQILATLAEKMNDWGLVVFVVTSKRHLTKTIFNDPDQTLCDFLDKNGIDYYVSTDINKDSAVSGKITDRTIGISLGAAWIFKQKFIDLFGGRLINLHGSRLPKNRGGGGFSWRIMMGDRSGAALIHKVDSGIDTGDIIKCKEYIFPPECRTPAEYQDYYIGKYLELMDEFIQDIKNKNEIKPVMQQECLSTYWPRLNTEINGYIDWSWNLEEIERFICAFDDPYIGAITYMNDSKVHLKKCHKIVSDGQFHPFQKGVIYRIYEGKVFVATENGSLVVTSVSNHEGEEVLNDLNVGDRFFTPLEDLEKAKKSRVVYTSNGLKDGF